MDEELCCIKAQYFLSFIDLGCRKKVLPGIKCNQIPTLISLSHQMNEGQKNIFSHFYNMWFCVSLEMPISYSSRTKAWKKMQVHNNSKAMVFIILAMNRWITLKFYKPSVNIFVLHNDCLFSLQWNYTRGKCYC